MTLVLSAEQDELRATVRRFLERTSPTTAVREIVTTDAGYDVGLWKRMAAELGLAGIAVPEAFGGSGFGTVELAVVCEELGRGLVPSPYFASVVLAATLLLELADAGTNLQVLPGLAAGDLIVTVALQAEGAPAPIVSPAADGRVALHGRVDRVLDADRADRILVVARRDGETVVVAADAAQPGLVRTPLSGLDPTRRQGRVDLDGAVGQIVACTDADAAVRRTLDRAAIALAAEQLGVLRRCVDLTVAYVKDRVQFGRVVGSFQAVKHGCVEMWTRYELAESAVRHAAAVADDPVDGPVAAALALAYTAQATFDTAADMVQYHGGIAYTWEHDAHLYYRRAHSAAVLLGGPDQHAARLADLIGL